MLHKHWDVFAIGFLSVMGAFTLGFFWGANTESHNYLSVSSERMTDILPYYGRANAMGRRTCYKRIEEGERTIHWLHSC